MYTYTTETPAKVLREVAKSLGIRITGDMRNRAYKATVVDFINTTLEERERTFAQKPLEAPVTPVKPQGGVKVPERDFSPLTGDSRGVVPIASVPKFPTVTLALVGAAIVVVGVIAVACGSLFWFW